MLLPELRCKQDPMPKGRAWISLNSKCEEERKREKETDKGVAGRRGVVERE